MMAVVHFVDIVDLMMVVVGVGIDDRVGIGVRLDRIEIVVVVVVALVVVPAAPVVAHPPQQSHNK